MSACICDHQEHVHGMYGCRVCVTEHGQKRREEICDRYISRRAIDELKRLWPDARQR